MAENTTTVRISGKWLGRVREIEDRAGVPQRVVIDKLVEHYGDAVETMLTSPVRVEPQAATGRRG